MAQISINHVVSEVGDADAESILTGEMIEALIDRIRQALEEERRRQERQHSEHSHESPAREAKSEPRLSSISITFLGDVQRER